MATEYPFFSHGEARRSDEAFEVRAPYDGTVVGLAYRASARDLEAAIAATAEAFEQTRALPSHRRAEILQRVAVALGRGERDPLQAAGGQVDDQQHRQDGRDGKGSDDGA